VTSSVKGEILLKNCKFQQLLASTILSVTNAVQMRIEDCIFDQITLFNPKFISFRGSSPATLPYLINNCSFTNIEVQSSLIYSDGESLSLFLTNVRMENITQQESTGNGLRNTITDLITLPRGICCSSVSNAQVIVESSNFSNISSNCFGLRDTKFTIKSSKFDNSQIQKLKDTERSGVSWINIEATSYFYGSIYQALIEDNKFIQNGLKPKYGGAIQVRGIILSQIIVTRNEFIGNKAFYGGAIYSDNNFARLHLDRNIFTDNSADNGGAIYKTETSSADKLPGASLSINNTQFIGNEAIKHGGALYIDWESLWISNSEFISNHATNGGALYYINLDQYGGLSNVRFIENSASNIGGAIKLFFKYSELKIDTTSFERNFDRKQQAISEGRPSYYILSFYDMMSLEDSLDNLEDLVKNSELTKLNFTVNASESTVEIQQKSGNELSQILMVQVFDNENNLADYVDNEEMIVKIVAFQNNISKYAASLVSSPIRFKFSNGQFFAKHTIKMHGEPETTATLRFQNVQGSSDFIQDSGMNGIFDIQVQFVDCEIGDIFDSSTRSCSTCAAGSYSFQDPYNATYCNQCPENIECYGGNKVGPKSGYWMYNPNTLISTKCPYSSACLGGYADHKYFLHGKCLYPHQGNLCNQCAPNHAKFGSSTKCEDCQNNAGYYLKFGFFFLLQVAAILGIFKLNIPKKEAEDEADGQIFYLNVIKILINFIQISSILINYDLKWSALVRIGFQIF